MTDQRPMQHSDFIIGGTFWCGNRTWRCTDIGTRTIIAIRIDSVDVESNVPELRRTLSRSEAEADGWFKGPPYAVAETVFDENDIEGCTSEAPSADADTPTSELSETAGETAEAAAERIAQVSAVREQEDLSP